MDGLYLIAESAIYDIKNGILYTMNNGNSLTILNTGSPKMPVILEGEAAVALWTKLKKESTDVIYLGKAGRIVL